jgi:hypothetical protein
MLQMYASSNYQAHSITNRYSSKQNQLNSPLLWLPGELRVNGGNGGESCSIRLWEREAYVLEGARTSYNGEVRESKHAVEPGANNTGPCGRSHGRHCATGSTSTHLMAASGASAVPTEGGLNAAMTISESTTEYWSASRMRTLAVCFAHVVKSMPRHIILPHRSLHSASTIEIAKALTACEAGSRGEAQAWRPRPPGSRSKSYTTAFATFLWHGTCRREIRSRSSGKNYRI